MLLLLLQRPLICRRHAARAELELALGEGVRGSQVRLTKVVALARGARVAPRLCPAVTHIVVDPDERGAAEVLAGLAEERRALLQGGAARVPPVLRPEYVHESADAADKELEDEARPDARLGSYAVGLPEPAASPALPPA
eukprot:tig00020556_g11018.t1